MKTRWQRWRWVEPVVLSFLILTPLLLVIMGLLCITPLHAGTAPALPRLREPGAVPEYTFTRIAASGLRQPASAPSSGTVRGTFGLSLDPHNDLHLFLLLPALAAFLILAGSLAVWAVLRWTRLQGQPVPRLARIRYGLLGLVWWLALSVFLIFDLVGAVSLHLGFVGIYALCWVLVGLLLLHAHPAREKMLVVALFLALLLSLRCVDWNSRKPFLRDFDRVRLGMTETEADQAMDGYLKGVSPLAKVDDRGKVLSGVVAYRHTTESWGNSDVGILIFEKRRVVETRFAPD